MKKATLTLRVGHGVEPQPGRPLPTTGATSRPTIRSKSSLSRRTTGARPAAEVDDRPRPRRLEHREDTADALISRETRSSSSPPSGASRLLGWMELPHPSPSNAGASERRLLLQVATDDQVTRRVSGEPAFAVTEELLDLCPDDSSVSRRRGPESARRGASAGRRVAPPP